MCIRYQINIQYTPSMVVSKNYIYSCILVFSIFFTKKLYIPASDITNNRPRAKSMSLANVFASYLNTVYTSVYIYIFVCLNTISTYFLVEMFNNILKNF